MPIAPTEQQSNCKEKWCGVFYIYFFSGTYKGRKRLGIKNTIIVLKKPSPFYVLVIVSF